MKRTAAITSKPLSVVPVLGGFAVSLLTLGPGCTDPVGSSPPSEPAGTATRVTQASSEALGRKEWHETMRKSRTPKVGCFHSAYPSTEWEELRCTTPPMHPHLPTGTIYTALASPSGSSITDAYGRFPLVYGVTGEFNSAGSVANNYSLQLNTDFFPTPTCNNQPGCYGWQQFIFDNNSAGPNASLLFMEYWVFNYQGPTPPSTASAWTNMGGESWMVNSPGVWIPNEVISNLQNLQIAGLLGTASQPFDGSYDWDELTLIDEAAGESWAVSWPDSVLTLSAPGVWNQAQFNVVGSYNGAQAVFNSGTVITTETEIVGTTLPFAVLSPTTSSTTAESNNLNEVSTTTSWEYDTSRYATLGSVLTMEENCPPGGCLNSGINVLSASYGLNCGAFNNALNALQTTCDYRSGSCIFPAAGDILSALGDPCPGTIKDFSVEYTCGSDSTVYTQLVCPPPPSGGPPSCDAGGWVTLSCP